jgi:uncharacterized membrane protein
MLSFIIVVFTILGVTWLERTESKEMKLLLKWVPAILFAYIIPAIVTHLFALDLSKGPIHLLSRDWIMPLAVVSVMSALSIQQLRVIGWRPILVFAVGSAAVSLVPVGLFVLYVKIGGTGKDFLVDQQYWMGLITMVGSWIGGSTSQLILKEVVECPEHIFLTILVMENVLTNIWTLLMFQAIKRSDSLNERLGIKDPIKDFIPDKVTIKKSTIKTQSITVLLCIVATILAGLLIDHFLTKILILSAIGLLLGNLIRNYDHALIIKLGGYLIIAIMAILGLRLDFNSFSIPGSVVLFAVIWLILHYVFMMIAAYILRLNMAWVPIGSMANVGGISTAPAVTKAYNEEWMPPAILLAILSMVTGTYWGLLSIYLIRSLL